MQAALNESDQSSAPPRRGGAPFPRLAIRELTPADKESAAKLLRRGFPERTEDYWRQAMRRLDERHPPDGCPRFGFALVDGDRLVGLLLTIFSRADDGGLRCNLSSWYVEPYYRPYSTLLLGPLRAFRSATLINISPAPNTRATIEAQGFERYVSGAFFTIAALGRRAPGARVRETRPDVDGPLAASSAAYGCLSFEVIDGQEVHPFIFARTRAFGYQAPIAQLAYCRSVGDFIRYSGLLGRRLLLKGLPLVKIDALGPIPGLVGLFDPTRNPKYYRGPRVPRLGDLSETEITIFGS